MANNLGIVHPGLLAGLATNFYPSACTIQVATNSRNALGEPIPSWANLAGHVSLACAVAEPPVIRDGETETSGQNFVRRRKRVALAGAYTSVTEAHRAVVDGVTYDIEGVSIDSQGKTTYLDVEVVS
ncbi:MAG TPA: head-tail adaptor protein [Caldilineaceae bacterium]|nr:head-tail adaptor protein [Caldilineaceae bacterium]